MYKLRMILEDEQGEQLVDASLSRIPEDLLTRPDSDHRHNVYISDVASLATMLYAKAASK